jgi:hypothetical protein
MSFDSIRVEDILAIHTDQIARYGGGEGIRDPGLLEAALFRPHTGYYPTLIDEAAALWKTFPRTILLLMATSELHLPQPMYFWQLMGLRSLQRMTKLKTLFWGFTAPRE